MTDQPDSKDRGTTDRSYTVIIPSKDRLGMLEEALDSVFAQTLAPASVVLVVDEPADETKYAFLSQYDTRLHVLFTGGGSGGAQARNAGLDRVVTPYVFFLDDDDLWLPSKVERQIEALSEHPEWTGVTCWRIEEGRGKTIERRVSPWWLRTFGRARNVVGSFSQFGMRVTERSRALRLEPMLRSAQDLEFFLQVLQIGPIGMVEESLVKYRLHAGPRITGSDRGRLNTLESVYRKHRAALSRREDAYWRALLACETITGDMTALERGLGFARVVFNLIRSGVLILGGEPILRGAVARLIRYGEAPKAPTL